MPANPAMGHGRPRKKKPKGSIDERTSAVEIARKERVARIFQMRRAGWSLTQIAEAENVVVSRIHAIITETLQAMVSEPLEDVRRIELARLDELLTGHYDRAVTGDGWATDRVLAIMERRAKFLGLDAPVKTEEVGALADAKASLLQKLDAMATRLGVATDQAGPVVDVMPVSAISDESSSS